MDDPSIYSTKLLITRKKIPCYHQLAIFHEFISMNTYEATSEQWANQIENSTN